MILSIRPDEIGGPLAEWCEPQGYNAQQNLTVEQLFTLAHT